MTTWALFGFGVVRERVILPIWILGLTTLFTASVTAVAREFGTVDDRLAILAIAAGNPGFLFLRGLPDGSGLGALVYFQVFAFLSVLVALMNTFLVVRHTRADEERGRAELLLASPVSRVVTPVVAFGIALLANLLVFAAISLAGVLLGLEPGPAAVTGLGVASVGVCFAGIGVLAAQVMPSSSGANGLAAATVGIAYVTRGVGDALGSVRDPSHVDASWISLLSPIGWAQASRPFSDANLAVLIVPVAIGVLAAVAAVVWRARRDLGSSLVGERTGSAFWSGATALRFAVRSQRGTTVAWSIGTIVLGLLAGVLTPFIRDVVGSNDALAELLSRLSPGLQANSGQLFTIALLGVAGTLATASGVAAVIRLRREEAEGRAELQLATRLTKVGWYARNVLVGLASALAVAVVGGVTAGVAFVLAGEPVDSFGTAVAMAVVHAPAGAVIIGMTALAFGALPRATTALGWGLLTVGLVVGQLGDLLGLPDWLQTLSPFRHVPAVPLEAVDPVEMGTLLAIAAAAIALGGVALRRRDLTS